MRISPHSPVPILSAISPLQSITSELYNVNACVHYSNCCSTKTFSIIQCNYEKHALRVSRVIAVLAKSTCKHAIFLATRVNKRDFTHHENGKYKGTESFDVYSQTRLSLVARVTAWLLAIPDTLFLSLIHISEPTRH